jgi:OmpA-OmpF porin, OOP family
MSTRTLIGCFVLVSGVTSTAFADDAGFYIGAGIGTAEHAENVGLKPAEVPLLTGRSDSRDTTWTATLGYRVNPNFAFELGYVDLGEMEATVADPSGGSDARGQFNFSTEGFTAAMVGRFPVGKWTPYIKAGVLFSETDLAFAGSVSGAAFGGRVKGDSEDALFGAGVTYDLGDKWAAQLDVTHVMDAGDPDSGQSDYIAATIGVIWRF